MPILTLRPNGVGDYTELAPLPSPPNWECVNEAVPDWGGSYVYPSLDTNWYKDVYNIEDPPSSCLGSRINSVTVWGYSTVYYGEVRTAIKRYDALYPTAVIYGTPVGGIGGWYLFSTTYTILPDYPYTSWTWDYITTLQIGVSMWRYPGLYVSCTQVYAEIDYTFTQVISMVGEI